MSHFQYLYQQFRGKNLQLFTSKYGSMLTGSMIEKFTKRIQDLNKVKQEYTDVPHYNLDDEQDQNHQEQEDNSNDYVAPQKQRQSRKNGDTGDNEELSNGLKNQMKDCDQNQSQRQQGQNQENQGGDQNQSESDSKKGNARIQRNKREEGNQKWAQSHQRSYLLQKIRGKLANYKPKDANSVQNANKAQQSKPNSVQKIKRKGRPPKQNKQKTLSKLQKKQKATSEYSSNENSSKSQNKSSSQQQDQDENRQRNLAAEILNATKNMTANQKQQYIKIRRKQQNIPSKLQLKLWVDSYQMIFNVENQIKAMAEKPEQRTISRMFAQLLHKHVKRNPTDKKYKLRRICWFALKELNLKSQKVQTWLNRFMLQNCMNIKGVDLSQYQSKKSAGKSKDKDLQSNKQKSQSKDKEQINAKNVKSSDQNENKSKGKDKQNEKSLRPISRTKKFARRGRAKIINLAESESQKSSSQQQKRSSDSQSPQPKRKPQKIQQKKKQKKLQQQKYILKNQQIVQQKQNQSQFILPQFQKQIDQEQIFNYNDNNFVQQDNKIYEQSNNTTQVKEEIKNSKMYPQNFRKKIAAKLDSTLHQVYETLMRQKCEEFCVEEEALKQIYQEFGSFIIKKQDNELFVEQNNQQIENYQQEPQKAQQKQIYEFHKKQQQSALVQKPRIIHQKKKDQNIKKQNKSQTLPNTQKYQQHQRKLKQNNNLSQQKQPISISKQLKNKQRIDVQNYVVEKKKENPIPIVQSQVNHSSTININYNQSQNQQNLKKVESQVHATNLANIQNQQKLQKKQKPKDVYKLPQQSKVDETKQKNTNVNPFQIIGGRLMSFLRKNIGCSQAAIKAEAFKIVTNVPEVKGRIKEDSLARWTHSFIMKHKDKISVKVNSNDEQSNSAPINNTNVNANTNNNSNSNTNTNSNTTNSNSNSVQKPMSQPGELNSQPKIQIKAFSQPQPQPQPSISYKPNNFRPNQQPTSSLNNLSAPSNFSNMPPSSSSQQQQSQNQSSSQMPKPSINPNPMMTNYSNPNPNPNANPSSNNINNNINPNNVNMNKNDTAYRGFQVSMPKISIPRVDPKNFNNNSANNNNNNNNGTVSNNGSTTTQGSIKRSN